MFRLKTPFPRTQVDDEQFRKFIKKFGIVPYYGDYETSSHQTLDLLMNLTTLSPSYTSCLVDMSSYIFGQNFDVVGRSVPGLVVEDTVDIDFATKVAFVNYFKALGISSTKLIKVLKRVFRFVKDSGNAYLHLKRVQVGGSVRYAIKAPHYKHAAYLTPDPEDEFEYIIISKYLSLPEAEQRMSKYPPTILRATRLGDEVLWDATDDGVEEAVIHIENEDHNDEGDFYGRPYILSCLTWMYTDFEIGNLNSKIAATEIITKKVVAFEAPDPNTLPEDDDEPTEEELEYQRIASGSGIIVTKKKMDYFQRNLKMFREITTNLGGQDQTSSIGGVEYPYGSKPPEIFDLEINRDTKHHEFQITKSNAIICSTLHWSPELTGAVQTKANIGGNVLRDLFVMRNKTTIQPEQRTLENIANIVLTEICEREGGPQDFKEIGIQLPDVIASLVEDLSSGSGSSSSVNPLDIPNPDDDE